MKRHIRRKTTQRASIFCLFSLPTGQGEVPSKQPCCTAQHNMKFLCLISGGSTEPSFWRLCVPRFPLSSRRDIPPLARKYSWAGGCRRFGQSGLRNDCSYRQTKDTRVCPRGPDAIRSATTHNVVHSRKPDKRFPA